MRIPAFCLLVAAHACVSRRRSNEPANRCLVPRRRQWLCLGRTSIAQPGRKLRLSLRNRKFPLGRRKTGIDCVTARVIDFEPMPVEIETFGRTPSEFQFAADVIFGAKEDFVDPPALRGANRGSRPQGKLTLSLYWRTRSPAPTRGTTAGRGTAPDVVVSSRDLRGTGVQLTESPPVLRRAHGQWLRRTLHCRCLQAPMPPPACPGTGKCRSSRHVPS